MAKRKGAIVGRAKKRTLEPSKSQAILLIVYIVIGTIKYFYFDYAPISMQAAYFQAATFIECWELMIGTGKIATKFNNPFTFFHVLDFFFRRSLKLKQEQA